MIELGKRQNLEVVKSTMFGVYLKSKDKEESILLPKKQVPNDIEIGNEINVFVYRDSEDRLIATTKIPKIVMGELASLTVVDITKIGAFLDWGLEKDLFLPYKEQIYTIRKDNEYLVGLYIDKSERLCATMDIYKLLLSNSIFQEGDRVKGTIYSIKKDMGAFVAVENKYHGLIPKNEWHNAYQCGDRVDVRVTKVREDGKLYLSLTQKAYLQMEEDASIIFERIIQKGGKLSLNDKSSPEDIKKEFKMSKSAFKRAVGRLLKDGKIKFTNNGIEIDQAR